MLMPKIMKRILLIIFVFIALQCISYGQIHDTTNSESYEYMTIISEFPGAKVFLVYITPRILLLLVMG